jgi:hypothetical protein
VREKGPGCESARPFCFDGGAIGSIARQIVPVARQFLPGAPGKNCRALPVAPRKSPVFSIAIGGVA